MRERFTAARTRASIRSISATPRFSNFRAPEFGDYDVLEAVLPSARKRGMKTICWFEDVWRGDVPGIEQAQEQTFRGRNANTLCFNNPNYRNWLLGMVEDYARSYEIDGIMWGSERQGAFANVLGASHGGAPRDPGSVTCFCPHCEKKARDRGIDPERARQGFEALISVCGSRPPRQAPRGRVLRRVVAADAALSGAAGMGDAVDRQPARDLCRNVPAA